MALFVRYLWKYFSSTKKKEDCVLKYSFFFLCNALKNFKFRRTFFLLLEAILKTEYTFQPTCVPNSCTGPSITIIFEKTYIKVLFFGGPGKVEILISFGDRTDRIYRWFLICSCDSLSLVIPNNKMLEH